MAHTEKDFEKMELAMQKMCGCLNHYRKMERQIMNEPESEAKYEKVELMRHVIQQLSEPVNFWNNYQKKEQRKREAEADAQRKKELQRRFDEMQAEIRTRKRTKKYNEQCRYYCMTVRKTPAGDKVSHSCGCDMDMTYCGKECAFATNAVMSTRAYGAPVTVNHHRVRQGE